jgi:hypothetical protein
MARTRLLETSFTIFLGLREIGEIEAIAGTYDMTGRAWVEELVVAELSRRNTPRNPLPDKSNAFLIAVAEEWFSQIPDEDREAALHRLEKRSQRISDELKQSTLR